MKIFGVTISSLSGPFLFQRRDCLPQSLQPAPLPPLPPSRALRGESPSLRAPEKAPPFRCRRAEVGSRERLGGHPASTFPWNPCSGGSRRRGVPVPASHGSNAARLSVDAAASLVSNHARSCS